MSDATGTSHNADAPVVPGGRKRLIAHTVAALTLPNIMIYVAYLGILIVLLPLHVQSIDEANKVSNLAFVTGLGALVAATANPLAGALSDRTRSRFGRRTPWLLGAALCAMAALFALGMAREVIWVAIAFCFVQGTLNSFHAALNASMPERVPPFRRGIASAFIGLNVPLGTMIGVAIASQFVDQIPNGYLTIGALLLVIAIIFVIWSPDDAYVGATSPEAHKSQKWSAFFSAFKHSDYSWTFISRAAMILCYFLITGYQLYLLQDYIRLPEGASPPLVLVGLTTLMTTGMIASTIVCGWLSDLVKRRKIFVFGAAVAAGISLLAPLLYPTLEGMTVFAIVMGVGFGGYLAVDAALITQVLPDEETVGRDLGVLNIANAGPQIAAPFLAAVIIQNAGGYPALFISAAIMAAISALAIMGVKGVR